MILISIENQINDMIFVRKFQEFRPQPYSFDRDYCMLLIQRYQLRKIQLDSILYIYCCWHWPSKRFHEIFTHSLTLFERIVGFLFLILWWIMAIDISEFTTTATSKSSTKLFRRINTFFICIQIYLSYAFQLRFNSHR